MKIVKKFEDFKLNNKEGSIIDIDDIIECIKSNGLLYTNIVKNNTEHNSDDPVRPLSVDNQGLITVDIEGKQYYTDIEDVIKIDY